MCRLITCSSCNKPTFTGCGMHIEQVLGHVPKDKRCRCRDEKKADTAPAPTGFWGKLLG
jgi:hypothetical protein